MIRPPRKREKSAFQLTTSRRGRPLPILFHKLSWSFNSRPHEEVDLCLSCFTSSVGVSTHDLTKRSTLHSTCRNMALYLFQLTTSRRGRLIIIIIASVLTNVSTHDLTKRSTGSGNGCHAIILVSTHDLTKRSTAIFTQKVFLSKSLFVLIAYNIFILH